MEFLMELENFVFRTETEYFMETGLMDRLMDNTCLLILKVRSSSEHTKMEN